MAKGPYTRRERPGTRAICACGLSGLSPYCDGAHLGTGIEPEMVEIEEEREVSWCLCRRSGRFPFCDGSHARD
jgi:CDGSH-type Zn-finger protein